MDERIVKQVSRMDVLQAVYGLCLAEEFRVLLEMWQLGYLSG